MDAKGSGTNGQALQDTAAAVRGRLRAARAALTPATVAAASATISAQLRQAMQGRLDGRIVAGFWPMPGEPDLRALLTEWARAGHTVALPCVAARAAPLVFLPWHPEVPMRTGAFGIAEPAPAPPCLPDIVLVPLLGYTERGERVGYGGGYYDRTLAAWRDAGHAVQTVGVAWAASRLAPGEYPFAAHDMPMQAIVDENGWHDARAA